jgi:hypothetical protein
MPTILSKCKSIISEISDKVALEASFNFYIDKGVIVAIEINPYFI